MHLYSIMVAAKHPTDGNVYIYSRDYELSSFGFFYKNTIKESFKFLCRESVPLLPYGTRHTVVHEDQFTVHVLVSDKQQLAVFTFCDSSYPRRIAFKACDEVLELFESKVGEDWVKHTSDENIDIGISSFLKKYKDPKMSDALTKAQSKADDIKIILHENIRKLLERGENLEKLVDKSKDLSEQSKLFFKQTKKMNKSCCNIF